MSVNFLSPSVMRIKLTALSPAERAELRSAIMRVKDKCENELAEYVLLTTLAILNDIDGIAFPDTPE
jgi:hypothetical protein